MLIEQNICRLIIRHSTTLLLTLQALITLNINYTPSFVFLPKVLSNGCKISLSREQSTGITDLIQY